MILYEMISEKLVSLLQFVFFARSCWFRFISNTIIFLNDKCVIEINYEIK